MATIAAEDEIRREIQSATRTQVKRGDTGWGNKKGFLGEVAFAMVLKGHIPAERGGSDQGVHEDREAVGLQRALGRWM